MNKNFVKFSSIPGVMFLKETITFKSVRQYNHALTLKEYNDTLGIKTIKKVIEKKPYKKVEKDKSFKKEM